VADVVTFEMPSGLVFDWHTHHDHQLAWAASGVLTVRTDREAWVLPPTRSLFIPAGVRHETLSTGNATMRAVYLRPDVCPIDWQVCTPVAASTLLAEVIGYLEDASLDPQRRAHGETMLVDLLEPVTMTNIDVRIPADERARAVAQSLFGNPADGRTLADWGRDVGASERTLARAFLADTGLSFGQWRGLLRVRAATVALATGEPVARVARQVGYESTSAFVAAFRRATGTTPAAYFAHPAEGPG
jgi:AraC-like DNA-binding protein